MKMLRWMLLSFALGAIAAGIAASALRLRRAAESATIHRSTWCPSPSQRASVPVPGEAGVVTDDGHAVEEVPLAPGGPTP